MPVTRIVFPELHAGQLAIHNSKARFRVVAGGRRFGKTFLGASETIEVALHGGRAWWVAPSYKMARVGWRAIKSIAQQLAKALPNVEVRRGDLAVHFPGGGEVWVRSADNPDSLRGEGLDFVVLDEAAYMHEEAWTEVIRPALSDRLGRALLISTPAGTNWFYRVYLRGKARKNWQSFHFPTSANPHIPAAEIKEVKATLPRDVFRQEYLAEFIDGVGAVFHNVRQCATAKWQREAVPGHNYVIGIDWGRVNDYTVLMVFDATLRAFVHYKRFTGLEYAKQLDRVHKLYDVFKPQIIIGEENSMGGPLVESLKQAGLPIVPFRTTPQSKKAIIDALAFAFEQGSVSIVPDREIFDELQAFMATQTASGYIRYTAPQGMHDDIVMAMAIAFSAVSERRTAVLFQI